MRASHKATFYCASCAAPMDEVQSVTVLASLTGHSIFECEWCGHLTLVPRTPGASRGAEWLHALSPKCQRGISCLAPMPVETAA